MKKIIAVIAILTLSIGVFYSCGKKEDGVVKIGVIMSQTGPLAEPGKNALQGIITAIEQYNSKNDRKIELIIEDAKSDPKEGVTAMNKLVSNKDIKIIIGDIMSSSFLACAPIAEKNKIVFISPGASNPSVRDAGDYIFRDYLSDDFDGKVMASYIYKNLDKENVALINVNNDYGVGVEKVFLENFKLLGGNISLHERYQQGQSDFRNIILKIKETKPDVLYIVGNPSENGNLVKQLKELNVSIPITGNLSFESKEFIEIAKGTFNEIIFSAPYFDIKSDKSEVNSFVQSYIAKYKIEPDIAASLGYDVGKIIIWALKESDYDLNKIKDNLYKLKDFDGITGKTTFDSMGDVIKDVYIKSIEGNGNIKELELYQP